MSFEIMSDLCVAGFCGLIMVCWLARELAIEIRTPRTRR
jgi:hypothetical protein